nr:uncharacterized protein LOC129382208 [Dermacentor andersoni]
MLGRSLPSMLPSLLVSNRRSCSVPDCLLSVLIAEDKYSSARSVRCVMASFLFPENVQKRDYWSTSCPHQAMSATFTIMTTVLWASSTTGKAGATVGMMWHEGSRGYSGHIGCFASIMACTRMCQQLPEDFKKFSAHGSRGRGRRPTAVLVDCAKA